jgi:membrane-associated protease RseP (regulator of RpoE activity)
MLKRLSTICFLLIAAVPLFAGQGDGDEGGERRTIVVRDGKVLVDDWPPFGGKRAYIGVAMVDLTPELREFFGAPKDAGVLVSSLTENGPAAKAGLRVGDVITAVNGKPVDSMSDVVSAMRDKHAGDAIRIDAIRGKSRQSVVATAEEREPERFHAFKLPMMEGMKGTVLPRGEWKAFVNSPDTDDLHARIRELENRLQELEKKLQK